LATDPTNPPIGQLREFLVARFAASGDLEAFVSENFYDLSAEISWEASLTNQAREFTTLLMSHGRMDQLWPALHAARPELSVEIERLSKLDWSAGSPGLPSPAPIDRRLLAGGAAAVVLAVVIGVVVVGGGSNDTDAPTSTASPTTQPATSTEPPSTTQATTTTAAPAASSEPRQDSGLEVTSIRAFNSELPEEQSAIQLLVANRGDVPVNVDRVTFEVSRTGSADCVVLPFTGFGSYFARGADLPAYSVPIYEYRDDPDMTGRLTLNPPRRFEADGEETLLTFDLDETRMTPDEPAEPPYVDEVFLLDGIAEIGYSVFELEITLETTSGDPVSAGTVAVAHPQFVAGLLAADQIPSTCDWNTTEVDYEGLDPFSVALLENRESISPFCETPVTRGVIGANDQLDAALREADLCDE